MFSLLFFLRLLVLFGCNIFTLKLALTRVPVRSIPLVSIPLFHRSPHSRSPNSPNSPLFQIPKSPKPQFTKPQIPCVLDGTKITIFCRTVGGYSCTRIKLNNEEAPIGSRLCGRNCVLQYFLAQRFLHRLYIKHEHIHSCTFTTYNSFINKKNIRHGGTTHDE